MFVETKETGEVQQAKVGTLKLSEAMRIGARIRPQCFSGFWEEGKSCALAAAMEGAGAPYGSTENAGKYFPHYWNTANVNEIFRRNDQLRWTREQIADWLESQGY